MNSQLTPQQWKTLLLVDENGKSAKKICHELYGNQVALPRTFELLAALEEEFFVHYVNQKFVITPLGKQELTKFKPIAPFR
jgi:hypothetical protein